MRGTSALLLHGPLLLFAFSIGYSILALNSGMTLWVDRHPIRIVKRRAEGAGTHCSPVRPLRESEPGVSEVQWLPIPPGNENCLKNRAIPSSFSDMSR